MSEIKNWALFFQGKTTTSAPVAPYIRIKATGSENWNNFSFNFDALIEIVPADDRTPLTVSGYVIPILDKDTKRLGNWINSNPQLTTDIFTARNSQSLARGRLAFTSLLGSDINYRKLTEWSQSIEERLTILHALNDIIVLQNSSFENVAQKMLLEPSFTLGVLRSPSAYRALHRGWRCIQGKEVKSLADTRQYFNFKTQLHGFDDGIHELSVNFIDNELYEDRIHCLIGVNGTGKTRLLRELILTLSTRDQVETNGESSLFAMTEATTSNEYEGLQYNRLLVFSSDSEDRYPYRNSNAYSFEYQFFNLAAVNNGNKKRQQKEKNTLTTAIVDLLRDDKTFATNASGIQITRFVLFRNVLRNHIDLDALYLPVSNTNSVDSQSIKKDEIGNLWINALDLMYMNEQSHLELTALVDSELECDFFVDNASNTGIRQMHPSSGQLIFFRFALKLVSSIDDGSLVIIDEPETHLHPNLICDFVSLLYYVLTATKSIALVATHSAYVVREVPTHCVHVLSFSENSRKVNIGHVRLKTLGANIDSISQAVFGDGDNIIAKYHETLALGISKSKMTQEEILNKYASILSPELLIEIRALMKNEGENP